MTDIEFENIKILAKKYKSINIVTNHVEKFKKLEKSLEEDEGIIISITNNKKRSLMKSGIIINIDFPNELINKYEFKSNWDRYFEPVVNKEDLENNLNELYNYRNLVAHNRLIREKDRNRSNELITKIEKVFNECLTKIDDIKVPEEDKEKFENMSSKILSPITNNIDELGCISSIDSMRGIFGFDSGIVSSLDSVKKDK